MWALYPLPGYSTSHMGIPPTRMRILPTCAGIPPSRTGIPPTRTGISPSRMGIPPTHTGIPPTHTGIPPTHAGIPPTHTGIPPTRTAFHPLARAFHPLARAFHPLARAFHSLARASQLRTITLSAHPNDNSQLVCPPAGAHTATPASHLGFAPGALVAGILAFMPTFTPTPAAHEGLGLLAAAATASPLKALAPVAIHSLSGPGPYNPSASLPAKLVKRILELEFAEMSEISVADADPPQVPGRTPTLALLPVTDISVWVERFSMIASIFVTRFPDKAAELFTYQASIVRAEQNYEGKRWVIYDRQYRREAVARKDFNWSISDSPLYNEAFTGRVKAISRCNFCLQDAHATTLCPQNPNLHPVMAWIPDMMTWPALHTTSVRPPAHQTSIYRRCNEGRCKFQLCKYRHECLVLWGPQMALERPQECPNPRSRSPIRGMHQPPSGPSARGPCF